MSITPLPIPITEKSRLHLSIQGKSCVSALFRAELKKELNFFRGCNGIANNFGDDTVDIISEGKTSNLIKFLDWIEIMTKDITERKANFQSESLTVKVLKVKWENYTGDVKGFQFLSDSPSLNDMNSVNNDDDKGKIEANTMAGTDESVLAKNRMSTAAYPWLFIVEYYDPLPRLKRQYLLRYWGVEGAQGGNGFVEMVDIKSKKLFLKKSPAPETLSSRDLVLGAKILLYSRELDIVDFGDGKTKNILSKSMSSSIIILSPETYKSWGKIVDEFIAAGNLIILKATSMILNQSVADNICNILEHQNLRASNSLTSGVSLILHLTGENGIDNVTNISMQLNGPKIAGTILASNNNTQLQLIKDLLFVKNKGNVTATLDNCTCCIIKPHAVKAGDTGKIINDIIKQGYEISCVSSLNFTKVQAEEFLEVYKGVIPDYMDHVVELCSGLSIALEVRAENAVETFRSTAGPWDIEMAKEIRPLSLRGLYGETKVRSAIHCTDLPIDAAAECEYCFRILE